jgi:hypothetical protein
MAPYAARFVAERLAAIRRELLPDDRLPPIPAIPSTLFGDLFERVVLHEADALQPVQNEGWTLDAKERCWKSGQPGSRIEFEIEGRALLVMDWQTGVTSPPWQAEAPNRSGKILWQWPSSIVEMLGTVCDQAIRQDRST